MARPRRSKRRWFGRSANPSATSLLQTSSRRSPVPHQRRPQQPRRPQHRGPYRPSRSPQRRQSRPQWLPRRRHRPPQRPQHLLLPDRSRALPRHRAPQPGPQRQSRSCAPPHPRPVRAHPAPPALSVRRPATVARATVRRRPVPPQRVPADRHPAQPVAPADPAPATTRSLLRREWARSSVAPTVPKVDRPQRRAHLVVTAHPVTACRVPVVHQVCLAPTRR